MVGLNDLGPVLHVYGPEKKQVSCKNEVGVRVNDFVVWLTLRLNFENLFLIF